jgi:hypothetical protein
LRFAAEIFCSADYLIFIHGSASLCLKYVPSAREIL